MFDWLFGKRRKQMEELAKARASEVMDAAAEAKDAAIEKASEATAQAKTQASELIDAAAEAKDTALERASDVAARASDTLSETTSDLREKASQATASATAKLSTMADPVGDVARRAQEVVSATTETVGERLSDATEAASETVAELREQASETARQVQDSVTKLVTPVAASGEASTKVGTQADAGRPSSGSMYDLSELEMMDDLRPEVGLPALFVAPPLVEVAKVVKVQAGGRRVTAIGEKSAIARTFARRADGTYWLEGAPAGAPSRLIVGAEL